MKNNKQKLYEAIMQDVSKVVKENINSTYEFTTANRFYRLSIEKYGYDSNETTYIDWLSDSLKSADNDVDVDRILHLIKYIYYKRWTK